MFNYLKGKVFGKSTPPPASTYSVDRATPNQKVHRQSCIQGYRAKGELVREGKGHNTLAGIPAVWLS